MSRKLENALDNQCSFIYIIPQYTTIRLVSCKKRNHQERGRNDMPTYEYECLNCKKKFTLIQSISEHEKGKASCPKCKSAKVKQIISAFTAKTSRKS